MSFVVENIRLRELSLIAESNKEFFDDFIGFLETKGYASLYHFVHEPSSEKAKMVLLAYFSHPSPIGCHLYDGIARPYQTSKAKWLLLGWIFRDAPEQRLRPMLVSMPGESLNDRKANLFNQLREYLGVVFPSENRWTWTVISEVMIDRLEGSRRAIKGTLFEVIVRRTLYNIFHDKKLDLCITDTEVRLEGETYDVQVKGRKGHILMPVKTRETMGGGHAGLFTRDIHKSISVAHRAGFVCLPIIIAESWGANLNELDCEHSIYIDRNPNQVIEVEPILDQRLREHLELFRALS